MAGTFGLAFVQCTCVLPITVEYTSVCCVPLKQYYSSQYLVFRISGELTNKQVASSNGYLAKGRFFQPWKMKVMPKLYITRKLV